MKGLRESAATLLPMHGVAWREFFDARWVEEQAMKDPGRRVRQLARLRHNEKQFQKTEMKPIITSIGILTENINRL
jgi:hypothetical protein